MDLRERIKEICYLPVGVDLFGVAPAERISELADSGSPEAVLPGAKSVVVMASQVFKVLTDGLTADQTVGEVSSRDVYDANNETVIRSLEQTGYHVARFLTNQGFPSVNVGQDLVDYRTISSLFSFKTAAVAAGIGVIGKHGLLLTPAYGPRVKLGAVITRAPLPADPMLEDDLCRGCSACIEVCPSGALQEPEEGQRYSHDRFVCCSFYAANKGCSLCLSRCPL